MGFEYRIVIVILTVVVSLVVGGGSSSSVTEKDREECREQLIGMATCLPYVGGGGDLKTPTPTTDCCNGLKQVLKNDKKCLCVIIVDRNDPQLSLNINVTLALTLPSVCHASANVSQCPELLHLAPNSTDAQVFYQFSKNTNQTASNSTDEGIKGSSGSGGSGEKINSSIGISMKINVSFAFLFFTILSFTTLV